jgi:hypothetical protein
MLTVRVELAPGVDPAVARVALESAARDVLKLRAGVDVVAPGTIDPSGKRITDERSWT